MDSGPGSGEEERPPALPVKQHRSHSSRCSSVESDCAVLSPVGLQHQYYACNEVFSEPTDCHAAQCPIHQRYDPSQHQMRFFSDGTPPPVPKKRLSRTLSLPGYNAPPLSPLQRQPQNFDNPLYMLAPLPHTYFHEEEGAFNAARGGPGPFLSLSQLSFDTPDEYLPYLFTSLDDQEVVFQGIQHRHLLFLRSMAQSVDAGILLQGQVVSSYPPRDFLLSEGSEPNQIGGAVYCSLRSPKLPGRVLGLRVHKQTDEASSAHNKLQPSHVNVQDVVAHFQPSNTRSDDSSMLRNQDPPYPFKAGCTVTKPSGGGSNECSSDNLNPSVESLLMRGHSVSVERDLPHATLEDFVQNSISLQNTDCLDYDRHVCVLLLQVLMGSQYLYNTSATAAELKPRYIFLVWPNRERENRRDEQELDASENNTGRLTGEMERVQTEKIGKFQMLWKTHGSPRVVLTPLSSSLAVPQPLMYIKSKIGALIQYCLHSQESLTSASSGPALSKSSYRRGLLYLASVLHRESSGPQMAEIVAMLQVLLWGPRVPLFDYRRPMTTAVHNWLTIKRALLVMKLAERALIQDQSALDWEDCMSLQYLAFTDPEAVVSVIGQLWLTLNED